MEGKHSAARKLGWKTSNSEVRFENKILRLKEDTLSLPKKGEMKYAWIERGPAVIIVPVTDDGKMILVRQFRYVVDDHCLEVPAGTSGDVEGLPMEELVAKELKEEIGASFRKIERIGDFYSNSSMSDEVCHVFLVTGVKLTAEPEREPAEEMETLVVPVEEALELARSGKMKTGPSALAVLLAEPRVRALTGG